MRNIDSVCKKFESLMNDIDNVDASSDEVINLLRGMQDELIDKIREIKWERNSW